MEARDFGCPRVPNVKQGGVDMKNMISILALFAAVAVQAGTTVVVQSVTGDVSSGLLTVNYRLSGDSAVITLAGETNDVPVADSAFRRVTGDVNKVVVSGDHEIRWYPDDDFGNGAFAPDEFKAVVKVWPTNSPPDYLVIDLKNNTASYYTCTNVMPGRITDVRYLTDEMVFRRIPAAGVVWRMGSPIGESGRSASYEATRYVKLNADYYLAVFETTQCQAGHLFGVSTGLWKTYNYGIPGGETNLLPHCRFTYNSLRGNAKSYAYWPVNGHDITYTDGFGAARTKYSFAFDYPTEAQWEFACRSGESAAFNNGCELGGNPYDPQLNDTAWHVGNSSNEFSGCAFPHRPGLLRPNRLGLYDMLGNVAEYCLDSYGTVSQNASDASAVVEDPAGPNPDLFATYVYRTLRGGGFASKASDCRSSSRVGIPMGWDASDSIYYNVGTRPEKVTKLYQGSMGVRVCLPAVAVK